MSTIRLAVLTALLSCLGCVSSLHPLYTDDTLIHDPKLVGTWVESKPPGPGKPRDPGTISVSRDGRAYSVCEEEDGETVTFNGHLTKIGNHLYLDLSPRITDVSPEVYSRCVVPTHLFFRVRFTGDELALVIPNLYRLRELILANSLEHVKPENGITVLTVSTSDLRELVAKHSDDVFAEHEAMMFTRR